MLIDLRRIFAAVVYLCFLSLFVQAQAKPAAMPDDFVRSHRTKYECRTPMRDSDLNNLCGAALPNSPAHCPIN